MHGHPINSRLSTHFAPVGAPALHTHGCPICLGPLLSICSGFRQPQTHMGAPAWGDVLAPPDRDAWGPAGTPGRSCSGGNKCHRTTTPRWVMPDRSPVGWQGSRGPCSGRGTTLCLEIINPGVPDKAAVLMAPRDQGAAVVAGARGDLGGLGGGSPLAAVRERCSPRLWEPQATRGQPCAMAMAHGGRLSMHAPAPDPALRLWLDPALVQTGEGVAAGREGSTKKSLGG